MGLVFDLWYELATKCDQRAQWWLKSPCGCQLHSRGGTFAETIVAHDTEVGKELEHNHALIMRPEFHVSLLG